tara:strand:- start:91 stop:282 length:192 start_codon:yes stop_codon:yes gene_type:complete
MSIDSLRNHLKAIETKHRKIDTIVNEMTKALTCDDRKLKKLKTEKLGLKQEMTRISNEIQQTT